MSIDGATVAHLFPTKWQRWPSILRHGRVKWIDLREIAINCNEHVTFGLNFNENPFVSESAIPLNPITTNWI